MVDNLKLVLKNSFERINLFTEQLENEKFLNDFPIIFSEGYDEKIPCGGGKIQFFLPSDLPLHVAICLPLQDSYTSI